MRDVFAAQLLDRAREDERIVFLTGDLGFGVFEKFQEELPDQYLNVGVAEQNMVAVATGLALEGRICFTYSIGNFPVLRCLEQIRNDAAYHDANVKVVSIGGGFSYGALGMSHHATEDIAVMRSMPGMTTFVPGTREDVRSVLDVAVTTTGACYLRLDKSAGYEMDFSEPYAPGSWRVMRPGRDAVVVAAGGVLEETQTAAVALALEGIDVAVVNAVNVSPVDGAEIARTVGDAPLVVTVEEHVVRGGLGGAVAEAIAEEGLKSRLVRLGIGSDFMSVVGSQKYLRRECSLDAESLIATIRSRLRGAREGLSIE